MCLGGQKNFQSFMQRMKDEGPLPPDAEWFRRLIATAILYRAVERAIRAMKFPAYGAQIVAYLVAGLSHRTGGGIDFARIWSSQTISPELEALVRGWAPQIDAEERRDQLEGGSGLTGWVTPPPWRRCATRGYGRLFVSLTH